MESHPSLSQDNYPLVTVSKSNCVICYLPVGHWIGFRSISSRAEIHSCRTHHILALPHPSSSPPLRTLHSVPVHCPFVGFDGGHHQCSTIGLTRFGAHCELCGGSLSILQASRQQPARWIPNGQPLTDIYLFVLTPRIRWPASEWMNVSA